MNQGERTGEALKKIFKAIENIPKGYIVMALIGPAGCGKDTLLNELLEFANTQNFA